MLNGWNLCIKSFAISQQMPFFLNFFCIRFCLNKQISLARNPQFLFYTNIPDEIPYNVSLVIDFSLFFFKECQECQTPFTASHTSNCRYSLSCISRLTVIYNWKFFPNSAHSHWLLRGHMTSNNETVSRQNPWGTLQNLWRQRVTVPCDPRMLTDDRRYGEV